MGPVLHHLLGRQHLALAVEVVGAVAVELAHRRVERDRDVVAGRETGLLDRLDEDLDGVLVGGEVGREPAFVADRGRQVLVVEDLLERVVRLRAPAQRLRERRGADRHDHELLQVDRVVGVDATVDDVEHRHGQHVRVRPTDVAVQRELELVGGRLGDRQARAEDRVGADPGLVVGAVELDQLAVDGSLVERVEAVEHAGDLVVHEPDGGEHALAEVPLAAVAELDRLVLTGRRAARHRGPAPGAALEHDFDLDGRVAARVEDLAADDVHDVAHSAAATRTAPGRRDQSRLALVVPPRSISSVGRDHGELHRDLADLEQLVGGADQDVGDVRLECLLEAHVGFALLAQEPPVLEELVVQLGRLELAEQLGRHGLDDRLEPLVEPAHGDDVLRHACGRRARAGWAPNAQMSFSRRRAWFSSVSSPVRLRNRSAW